MTIFAFSMVAMMSLALMLSRPARQHADQEAVALRRQRLTVPR